MSRIYTKGSGLVEIVIAISVIILVITGVVSTYPLLFRTSLTTINQVQGSLLLEEGVEAVKVIRDISWTSGIAPLTASTTYWLSYSGGTWTTTSVHTMIDGAFNRTVALYNVYRDASDNITSSGGTLDPKTKKLTVEVSWPDRHGTTTRALSTYITDLFSN